MSTLPKPHELERLSSIYFELGLYACRDGVLREAFFDMRTVMPEARAPICVRHSWQKKLWIQFHACGVAMSDEEHQNPTTGEIVNLSDLVVFLGSRVKLPDTIRRYEQYLQWNDAMAPGDIVEPLVGDRAGQVGQVVEIIYKASTCQNEVEVAFAVDGNYFVRDERRKYAKEHVLRCAEGVINATSDTAH